MTKFDQMNFLATYNNSYPLFIGGHFNGKNEPVPLDYRWWQMAVPVQLNFSPARWRDLYVEDNHRIETYRQEWFTADGRNFRLMIHEKLPNHAGLMLMMSMCGEHPDLLARIKELETENAMLKGILKHIAHGYFPPDH